MVKGLETFRKAMVPYKEHFVIIGGTACDIRLTGTTISTIGSSVIRTAHSATSSVTRKSFLTNWDT